MKLTNSFLKEALPYATIVGEPQGEECALSIDTRVLERGEVFLALCGNTVNGHDYLDEALKKGACALIINQSEQHCVKKQVLTILVPDTLQALIDLAKAWRNSFTIPVIGVTGSVGKTTTKEMLRSIFKSAGMPACVSYKNQNTLVGLALNILRMRTDDKVAVFEVGISQRGEMEPKAELLRPTIGVVTTVAHAHMDGLGTIADIAREKRKIFSYFKQGDIGVICGDHPLFKGIAYSHPVVRFGMQTKNHVQARKLKLNFGSDGFPSLSFDLKLHDERGTVVLKTNHQGYVNNSLAASAAAYLAKAPFEKIVEGLNAYNGFEGRFEKRKLKNNAGILINDCYNANPESMKAALIAMHAMPVEGEKVAVLGDMLELGAKELFWHRQIGRLLNKVSSLDHVILVGHRSRVMGKMAPSRLKVEYADDWKAAAEILTQKLQKPKSLVLVKASHGMELYNLVEQVCEV